MKKMMIAAAIASLTTTPLLAEDGNAPKHVAEAAKVFAEIMATPDKAIPHDLLTKAHCAVIVPDLKKAGFIVGAKYGTGFVTCRKETGSGWSAPAAIKIEGGSVGFQIGASETDLVMLVMSQKGADKLMSSEFTLGGDASVAAGPVGRETTAQTDANLRADILSWSRSKGLFAGVSVEGATLRDDADENAELYGKKMDTRAIVKGGVAAPASAGRLLSLLNQYSAKEDK